MKIPHLLPLALLAVSLAAIRANADSPSPAAQPSVETIVLIRHGEKPPEDRGQLTFQGLNRALALPDVLINKFGHADYLFAPGTQHTIQKNGIDYYYIRPLITIEPTAIRLGLPVDAQFAFDDIDGLQQELLSPKYAHSMIFVAWEHLKLVQLVKNISASLGGNVPQDLAWPGTDYDTIYVLKITTAADGKRTLDFTRDKEGLDNESTQEPAPAAK